MIRYAKFIEKVNKGIKPEFIKTEYGYQLAILDNFDYLFLASNVKLDSNLETDMLWVVPTTYHYILCDNSLNLDIINKIEKIKSKIDKVSYESLSDETKDQIAAYINIFKNYNCDQHWQVNNIISENNDWGKFDKIRSMNNHGHRKLIKGIMPKYFAIICKTLEIEADDGERLIDYTPY
jgi:hypothetical protein